MKKFSWMLVLCLLCATQGFAGWNSLCCEDFDVDVEALWWKPCRSGLSYGCCETKHLDLDHEFGWRLRGGYTYDSVRFGVRWTHFHDSESKRVSAARKSYKIDYDVVDLELGYDLTLMACQKEVHVRPFVGAKLSWIDENFKGLGDLCGKGKLKFDGYGLALGSEQEVPLWCKVSLLTRGSIAILDGKFRQNGSCDSSCTDGKRGREHLCVPVLEGYVGLRYPFSCGCTESHVQLGYEVQYLSWREFGKASCQTSLGFHGLVAGLGTDF